MLLMNAFVVGVTAEKAVRVTQIIIGDAPLTIEDVVDVARHGEKVQLAPDAVERIAKCRGMLEKKIAAHEIMYGVNTGIGEFSEVVLSDEQVKQFQTYLIYNHAAGIGAPAPIEHVRAAMVSRINVHARGYSGCRPEIPLTYIDMLNKGVTRANFSRYWARFSSTWSSSPQAAMLAACTTGLMAQPW